MSDRDGRVPYLLAALLCKEIVLDEHGGTLRHLVSGAYEVAFGGEPGEPMEPLSVQLAIFIMLSAGETPAEHELALRSRLFPGGQEARIRVRFSHPHEVWSESIALDQTITEPGIYLIDVLVDDQLLTRIPYHVRYRSVGYG